MKCENKREIIGMFTECGNELTVQLVSRLLRFFSCYLFYKMEVFGFLDFIGDRCNYAPNHYNLSFFQTIPVTQLIDCFLVSFSLTFFGVG